MSQLFARSGGGTVINAGAASVTTPPFTMEGWARTTELTFDKNLLSLYTDGSGDYRHSVAIGTGENIRYVCRTTGNATCSSSTAFSSNVWFHWCTTATATDRRDVYLNGGGKGTSTASRIITTIDATSIGEQPASSGFYAGEVSHAIVRNIALSDAEVAACAAGYSLFIRPESIVHYWPLGGPYGDDWNDRVGGLHLDTAVGHNAPVYSDAEPPAFMFPGGIQIGVPNKQLLIPIFANSYRQHRV